MRQRRQCFSLASMYLDGESGFAYATVSQNSDTPTIHQHRNTRPRCEDCLETAKGSHEVSSFLVLYFIIYPTLVNLSLHPVIQPFKRRNVVLNNIFRWSEILQGTWMGLKNPWKILLNMYYFEAGNILSIFITLFNQRPAINAFKKSYF